VPWNPSRHDRLLQLHAPDARPVVRQTRIFPALVSCRFFNIRWYSARIYTDTVAFLSKDKSYHIASFIVLPRQVYSSSSKQTKKKVDTIRTACIQPSGWFMQATATELCAACGAQDALGAMACCACQQAGRLAGFATGTCYRALAVSRRASKAPLLALSGSACSPA
jgi:hypothetical protein